MAQGACKNCNHWWEHASELGSCRRHAPQPQSFLVEVESTSIAPVEAMAIWPMTLVSDRCGEWESDSPVRTIHEA